MNGRKMIFYVVWIAIFVSLLTPLTQADEAELNVVCTNSVLADFTRQIVGEMANVEYIMPAGACPSHFDTRPSDVSLIANADVVVSLGWEPWLNDLLDASGNSDVKRIECKGIGEWNLPSNAKVYVDKITQDLKEVSDLDNSTLEANAAAYKTEIDTKSEELLNVVNAKGQSGKKIIAMEWQKDFVEWLGYNVTAFYGPPEGLSTEDALEITEKAGEDEVCAIVDNLQSGTSFGANIASESGAVHVIFTNFPGAVPGTDTYIEMIDYNTNQLVDAVETYEYKKGEIRSLEEDVSNLEFQRTALSAVVGVLILLAIILYIMYIRK